MPLIFDEVFRETTEAPLGLSGWPMTAVLAFSVTGNARTEFHLGRLRFLIWGPSPSLALNSWAAPFLNADIPVDYFLTNVFTPSDFEQMCVLSIRMDASRVLTLRKNSQQLGQMTVTDVSSDLWDASLPVGVSLTRVINDPGDADLRVANMAIYNTAVPDNELAAIEAVIAARSGVTL